jgi:PilZ domain
MNKPSPTTPLSQTPARKHRRFLLQHPVRMTVHFADSAVEIEGVSRNVSIGGLLMESSRRVPPHAAVSFVMTVRGKHALRPMQFKGEGKVVRVDPSVDTKKEKAAFAIAVECQRPITQLDDYLGATGS